MLIAKWRQVAFAHDIIGVNSISGDVLGITSPWVCQDQVYTVPCDSNPRMTSNLAGKNVTIPDVSGIGG